jgi:hypothetical protein
VRHDTKECETHVSGINWTSILIILNNYFHDLATGLLLSSVVILWVLGRRAEDGGPAERKALAEAYPTLARFATGAFIWIILGGIPRTIFFYQFELIPAGVKGIEAALIVKHVFMVSVVIFGAIAWRRMGRLAKAEIADSGNQLRQADSTS